MQLHDCILNVCEFHKFIKQCKAGDKYKRGTWSMTDVSMKHV